ncbi:putative 4-mercaptohistidine N1-methyltransferase [bacterium]|nr:putative 4-mercaptohistidine N1-methyltransferase [bacterium]
MTGNDTTVHAASNPYETDLLVSQYCEFHYGEDYFGVGNFPATCARLCIEHLGERSKLRALEVGCAVGRATFELARVFPQVIGVDYSKRFIAVADELRVTGGISYQVPVEGDLAVSVERNLSAFGLGPARTRVEFLSADAMALPAGLAGFDLIFAGNLIDRLPRPRLFLSSIHERLNPCGLLVLTSPYTWLPEFTPREEWLGGYIRNGREFSSLEGLNEALCPHFTLSAEPVDVPFVIRETARKYQHTIAQMSVWQRA